MSSIKQKKKEERKVFGNITSSYKHRNVIGNKSGRGDGSVMDQLVSYKENKDPNRQQLIVPPSPVNSDVSMWAISESSDVDFNRMNENQIQDWIDAVPSPPS